MAFKVLANTENMPYDEWLDIRKQGIGGSDASIVCGINRYKSPVELWLDKTGQIPYQEAGEAAYWGTQLESLVRSEFSKRTSIFVAESHELLQSEEHPFMLANLDGVCEVPDYGPCIFEAKTASAFKAGEWEDATLPLGPIGTRPIQSRVHRPPALARIALFLRMARRVLVALTTISVPKMGIVTLRPARNLC